MRAALILGVALGMRVTLLAKPLELLLFHLICRVALIIRVALRTSENVGVGSLECGVPPFCPRAPNCR